MQLGPTHKRSCQEPEVDANVLVGEEEPEGAVPPLSESRPELYARLARARRQLVVRDLATP